MEPTCARTNELFPPAQSIFSPSWHGEQIIRHWKWHNRKLIINSSLSYTHCWVELRALRYCRKEIIRHQVCLLPLFISAIEDVPDIFLTIVVLPAHWGPTVMYIVSLWVWMFLSLIDRWIRYTKFVRSVWNIVNSSVHENRRWRRQLLESKTLEPLAAPTLADGFGFDEAHCADCHSRVLCSAVTSSIILLSLIVKITWLIILILRGVGIWACRVKLLERLMSKSKQLWIREVHRRMHRRRFRLVLC